MKAFDRVMAEPASLAARYALLAEWKATHHPQAALLENQLAYRRYAYQDRSTAPARALDAEIGNLIAAHGREWAGRIAELVTGYTFHRGLVAQVELPGARFLEVGAELLALAPIQHVNLKGGISGDVIEALAKSPLLAKLSSLHVDGAGEALGDRGASAFANSPQVANLVELSLWHDAIERPGVEALAASKYLATAKYVGLVGNPVDPTPYVTDEGDGRYIAGRPALAAELEAKHGPRPWLEVPQGHIASWPWHQDELALIDDYISSEELDRLEALALEVDRLATSDEEAQPIAGAKRQRLLIELDVSGLLTGQPVTGHRVATHKTLRAYHDACVAMASYHASAARLRLVPGSIASKPTDGRVSLDWFRTPAGDVPAGVPAHDWLALCERNFSEPMPTGTGERFVRLEGKIHLLSYRIEAGPEPKLWRAQPA